MSGWRAWLFLHCPIRLRPWLAKRLLLNLDPFADDPHNINPDEEEL